MRSRGLLVFGVGGAAGAAAACLAWAWLNLAPADADDNPETPDAVGAEAPAPSLAEGPGRLPAAESPEPKAVPDPAEWVDPFAQAKALTEAPPPHEDVPALDEDGTVEDALREAEVVLRRLTRMSPRDARVPAEAVRLRRLCLEALERWPGGDHVPRMRHLAILAAERLPIDEASGTAGIGEEMWAYASAAAAKAGGSEPERIVMREIRRAAGEERGEHAVAYGEALVAHAPESSEAGRAHVEMGKVWHRRLGDPARARKEYLEAGSSPDARIRMIAKKRALTLAVTRAEDADIVSSANALLAEEGIDVDDVAMVLYYRGLARLRLGEHALALEDCRRVREEHPGSRYAARAEEVIRRIDRAMTEAVLEP
jgi:hypothetical protein